MPFDQARIAEIDLHEAGLNPKAVACGRTGCDPEPFRVARRLSEPLP